MRCHKNLNDALSVRTKTILQLGAGRWMLHSMRLLRRAGFRVHAADRNPSAPGFAVADGYAEIDIVDADAITQYARDIHADLIMVVNGAGVISGSLASKQLGLPGLPPEVAVRSQDKGLCRERWRAAGLLQPDYRVVRAPNEIAQAAEELGYPVVIKPARKWGSRGVSVVHNVSQLPWAIDFALAEGHDGQVVVEQCVRGTEVSVEGLVHNGRSQVLAIGDKEMQDHPRYRVGMVLNYPAAMPQAQLDAIDNTISRAIRAMGIENGAFDADCMVNSEGVFLLEINPRPGGGHIFGQVVEAVSGVCMPLAYVEILLGQPVDIRPKFQRGVCYKFFCPPSGIFRSVDGLEEAREMPGVLDMDFQMTPGQRVTPVAADADRPGFVVATGKDRDEAIHHADRALGVLRYDLSTTSTRLEAADKNSLPAERVLLP
jgi:biotin carboxylase